MSKCFVTADLHLGHTKIISYEPLRSHFSSITEHDDYIEEMWRRTVSAHDVIYVIGDVAWNRKSLERIRNFPGIKKLVMGNHDLHDMRVYLQIFRKVVAYAEVAGFLLAHIPVRQESIYPRFKGQIHGHTHGRIAGAELRMLYYNVCLERNNFTPVNIQDIVSRYEGLKCTPGDKEKY